MVLLGLLVRGLTGQTQATPPDPEGVPTVPVFGDDVDAFIAGRPSVRTHLLGDAPAAMHARLREAAIRTEMLANGVSREAATAVVDDGRWTADREAAAFCQLDGVRGSHLGGRLSAALRGRTWAQYGAARTAAALVERSEAGQTPSTGEPATAAADGGSP